MTPVNSQAQSQRAATIIAFLAGLWLFVSPWVYGAYMSANAWNAWIVGALIAIFAAIQFNPGSAIGSVWVNTILGIWTFVSPWIYGYTPNTGRFVSSLCVGVVVFVASLASVSHVSHPGQPTSQRM